MNGCPNEPLCQCSSNHITGDNLYHGNRISSETPKGYSSGGVQSLSQMALLMELSLSQEKWEIRSFLIQMHLGKQADDIRLCEQANKKVNHEEES